AEEAGIALYLHQCVCPRALKDHHLDVADLGLALLRGGHRVILREKRCSRNESQGFEKLTSRNSFHDLLRFIPVTNCCQADRYGQARRSAVQIKPVLGTILRRSL